MRRIATHKVAVFLKLAAAPTFALMALLSGGLSGQSGLLCGAALNANPLSGMAAMYALMSVFHLAAWLRLVPRASGEI